MNMQIFRLINNLAHKSIFFDNVMIFFSNYVPCIFMLITVMIYIIGIKNKQLNYRKIAFSTVVLTIINLSINIIIRAIFHVDRPFINNKVNLLVPHDKASSLPSNHATGTMSIALGIEKYSKLLKRLMIILSIIVGFSRVYVGDHYPLDVVYSYVITFIIISIYNLKISNIVNKIYEIIEKEIVIRFKIKKICEKS